MLRLNIIKGNPGSNTYLVDIGEKHNILSHIISHWDTSLDVQGLIMDIRKVMSTSRDNIILNEEGYYDEGNGNIEHEYFKPHQPYVGWGETSGLYSSKSYRDFTYTYYVSDRKNTEVVLPTAEVLEVLEKWLDFLKKEGR